MAARQHYESNLVSQFASNNVSGLHRYIQQMLKRHLLPVSMSLDGNTVTDDGDKASLFNEYFYSVFSSSNLPDIPSSSLGPVLTDFEITLQDVFQGLSHLKAGKAPGIDGISATVLKSCATAQFITCS